MVTKVKTPTTPATPQTTSPVEPSTTPPAKASSSGSEPLPDAYQKAAQGLLGYKSSPLVSGAYKIFSDGIVFPPNILDTQSAKNDPNYLRLLAAIFGFEEFERFFDLTGGDEMRERKAKKVSKEGEKREGEKESDESSPEQEKEPTK
jgi:hypothetical protein